MNWRIFLTLGALSLAACSGGDEAEDSADSDGDGISDAEEEELGLDPDSVDSDNDGIEDGQEIEDGLDPLSADSDNDGYRDGDEITEGKDPLDDTSVIYEGGWPYSATKDDLDEADIAEIATEGELFKRFKAVDQFGQEVDLWDFKNDEGKLVIVDISAEWCPPCNDMAAWVDGKFPQWGDSEWKEVREGVENGDIYWITILAEDNARDLADPASIGRWYAEYPHPEIPVLPDNNYELTSYIELVGFPSIVVLNDDMTVAWKAGPFGSYATGLSWVKRNL